MSEHAKEMAHAFWDRLSPEQRSAVGRDRFLKASVSTIENNAEILTDDQVERILSALAITSEGGRDDA